MEVIQPAGSAPGIAMATEQPQTRAGLKEKLKEIWQNSLPSKEQCVACDRKTPNTRLILAPCQHQYCTKCLRKMGKLALSDHDKFPVKCCGQELPAQEVASTMKSSEQRRYNNRREEHAVPPQERMYCPFPSCGEWIHPRYLTIKAKPLKCPHCDKLICLYCRDLAHPNRECASDPSLAEMLSLARDNNWQRCYNCGFLVEKLAGCAHMICKCGAGFCYVCGYPSGNCPCNNPRNYYQRPMVDPGMEAAQLDMEIAEAILTARIRSGEIQVTEEEIFD